ncbi:Protein of unknown function, partial [Gryllus bimaculatus]
MVFNVLDKGREDIKRVLDPKYHGEYHAEFTFGRLLWMGAIEEYPGSKTYLRFNQRSKELEIERDAEDNASEKCLALDIASLEGTGLVRRNCSEHLPMMCYVQSKYIAQAYNASAPEACNKSNALSLLPLTGCYVINKGCYNYSVIVREQWFFHNLTNVRSDIPVVILQTNSDRGKFVKENETLVNATTLCYIGHGSSRSIKLRLKRVTIPGNINDEISNTCPDTTSPAGPPPGTTINHNASCLNCFREALHPCVRDFDNCTSCTEEHCGPFGINISLWRHVHTKDGNFEDFVDLPKDNKIARYFCENYPNKRRWIGPEYIPPESSFYLAKELEKTIEELRTLKYVTVKLPRNEVLTAKDIEEIISTFSHLFDRVANVSSLPELLESILIKAPLNVSFTTANLAVSKNEAIGFQLISDKPLEGLETFGKNPRQVPISSRDSITTEKMEAAVILPKISKETSVVVVTFAKGSDFTSCKGPANAKSQKDNSTAAYRMSFGGTNPVHEPTLPNHTESEENEEFKSESHCSYHKDLVRGCINTHVVQVGLLDGNGSYVQLPQGETVDILLRTKIMPMLGQTKTCAYWKPQE